MSSAGRAVAAGAVALAACVFVAPADAQLRYEREYPSIRYTDGPQSDRVASLLERLEAGELSFSHEGERGYLGDLLEALDISVTSQALVFTKTSFQGRLVDPQHPRAIYFNDDSYVAFVQRAEVLEISSVDPVKGATFWVMSQEPDAPPELQPETDLCLQCHDSYGLGGGGAPRYLVGTMLPDENGQSVFHEGWRLTDDRTPFRRRWGGWYVTGTHGDLLHRGNAIVAPGQDPNAFDYVATGNRTTLAGLLDTSPYPSEHADIVALMVLEHQIRVQNELTRVAYDVYTALHHDSIEGRAPAVGETRASPATVALVEEAVEPLVEALLFVDEAPLGAPIEGTSGYREMFEARGPFDADGRSLRELDLDARLFRYPLSYMVHSVGYDGLPDEAKRAVAARVSEILGSEELPERYEHLNTFDRAAVFEILRDTKPGFFIHTDPRQEAP